MNRTIFQFLVTCLLFSLPTFGFAKIMGPSVDLGVDKVVCVGTSTTLDAGNPGSTYSWSMGGAATQTRIVTSATPGTFTYIVAVTNNGTTLDTIKIEYLAVPAAPIVSNVTTCQGSVNLTASSPASQIMWFNNAGGTGFLGFGSPLLFNATTSTSVYAQAWNIGTLDLHVGIEDDNTQGTGVKGLKFDVLKPIVLKSVKMKVQLSGTVKIELRNAANQVLKTWPNYPLQGNYFLNTLNLNVPINTGNGYSLVLAANTCGNVRFYDAGASTLFPILTPGIIKFNKYSATAVDSAKFYYFMDPIVAELGCGSTLSPLAVTVLTTPNVAFGNDTVACNTANITLSMPAGGSYLWSTGATTQTITLSSPGGAIWGENTLNTGCSDKDTINVFFSTTPTTPTVQNTTTCVGNVNLNASSSANSKIVWRDGNVASAGYLGSGSPFSYNATTSTTLYAEAYNVSNPVNFSYPDLPAVSAFTSITAPKGLIFDVVRPIILDSITLFPLSSGQAYIEVQKSNGTMVARKLVTLPQGSFAKTRVGLGFTLMPGTGYKILFYLNQVNGATNGIKTHIGTFPQELQGYVKITGSTSGASTYVGFYDWEVRLLTCPTPKVPLVLTVNNTPSITLGNDTAQCGGTIALTMGNGNVNANPTWKNNLGTTLGSGINLTVNSANDGTIIAEATLGSCIKKDTINVEILSSPSVPTASNPAAACAGPVSLTANAGNNQILWWDAASGGNVVGSGSPFIYNTQPGNCSATTTTTLYAQSYAVSQYRRSVGLKTPGAIYSSAAGTGYRFDVNAGVTVRLDSISIYAAGSGSFVLELYNAAGILLQSKNMAVTGNANAQQLYVGFIIYEGVDYVLKVKNSSVFSLWSVSGAVSANYYPLSIPGSLSIKSGVNTTSNNVLNRYYSLYDWKVTIYPCGSASRTPVTISTLPSPNVNLGADQITCGASVTLNAGACAGATFSWMNNTTSQTLTVSAPGITTAAVLVSKTTNGTTCTDRDTAKVNIISSPTLGAMTSTTTCGGAVQLVAIETVPADTVLWWSAPTGGNVIAAGNPATYSFSGTQTVYAQGFNAANINLEVGAKTPDLVTSTSTINRGIVFNVSTPLWIEYVTVYTQSAGVINVELLNPSGVVVQQKFVNTQANYAPTQANLGFFVVPGNGYKLRLNGTTAGYLYADITNPTTFYNQSNMVISNGAVEDIRIMSSFDGGNSNIKNFYYYFYDWKIRPYRCSSARVPKTVTILPTPLNTLPKDTISCGGAVTLCSISPGATQVWSISPAGSGTSSGNCATMNNSGTIILNSTYPGSGCSDIDTVQVEISSTPSQLTANDMSVCPGEATIVATSNADYVAWFDAPTGGNLVTFGDTAVFYAISDTVLYVQGYNITQFAKPAGLANWTQNAGNMSNATTRGLLFDVYKPLIIDTVSIYLNTNAPSGSITIALLDKDLNTIATKVFSNWNVQTIGTKYLQKVPLGFFASPNPYGSYRLVLKTNTLSIAPPSDNDLAFEPTSAFPFSILNALYITAGNNSNNTPNTGAYYYFFDWKVRFGACETQRQAVNITLYPSPTHNVDLGADFTTCGDTILNPGNYPAGYSFEWNTIPPIYTQTLTITQSGTYSILVDNINGCGVSDTINATVNPLPLAAGTVTLGANNVITFNSIGSSSGTLSWNFGPAATSALAFGNYTYPAGSACNQTVTLVITNACGVDNITFPINLCVALEDDFAQQVNVYPNPTDGLIHIQVKEANSNSLSIRLTDMLGREIMAKKVNLIGNDIDTELDVQQVAAGMYQLILSTPDNKTAVKRVMIQR